MGLWIGLFVSYVVAVGIGFSICRVVGRYDRAVERDLFELERDE